MTDAFWSDTGVALENYESLLHTACSDRADRTARCRAIPILLRFYTDRLEEHRWLNHQEYGDNTIAFVWEQKLRYLMFQGTRKEGVRICCDSKSTVHVRLRRNGTPHRACFSVLPEHAGNGSLNCWRGGDADRVQCREAAIRLSRRPGDSGGQNRHGFRFIPLPSDFLCRTCEEEFHDKVSVASLTDDEVTEWCARMQCVARPACVDAAREHLAQEQKRLRLRTALMDAASRSVHLDRDAHVSAFASFANTDWSLFDQAAVEKWIAPHQRCVLTNHCLWTSYDSLHEYTRCFGLPGTASQGERWAMPAFLQSDPKDWTHYVGEARPCSPIVWCLRTWACAVGGVAKMHVDLQRELIRLEQEDNTLYAFVEKSAPSGGPVWRHVDFLHPSGDLPDLTCWRVMCTRALRDGGGFDKVCELRRRVVDLIRGWNIQYNSARHKYELSSAACLRTRDSPGERKGLVQAFRRKLRKLCSLTVDGWQDALRTNDEETEDSDACNEGGLHGGAAAEPHSDMDILGISSSDAGDGESANATDLSDAEGAVDGDVAMAPAVIDVGSSSAEDDDEEDAAGADSFFWRRPLVDAIRLRVGSLRLEDFSLRELRDVLRCTDFVNTSHAATDYPMILRAVAEVFRSLHGETDATCEVQAYSDGAHVRPFLFWRFGDD